MALKARPTTYRGIAMRSRLEARYAAMLDTLVEQLPDSGKWEYEPRAFASRKGQYLPDFVLRLRGAVSVYIEVRPDIAGAERAKGQMEIIWESEPDAVLWAECPQGLFMAHDDHLWEWRSTDDRLAAF